METDKTQKKKSNAILIVLIIILVLAVLGTAGFFAWKKYTESKTKTANTLKSDEFADSITNPAETANWKTYKSNELDLNFKYPTNWGEPQIVSNDYSKESGSAFSGKDYYIVFSQAEGETIATVSGYSYDFSAYNTGYVGDKGDLDLPEILTPTKGGDDYSIYLIRKKVTIADVNTYYNIDFSSVPEASGYNFSTIAYLNTKNSQYSGLTISRNYKTINDKLNQGYTGDESKTTNEEGKKIVANLNAGTISDQTALTEYQEYLLWLETFQYNE